MLIIDHIRNNMPAHSAELKTLLLPGTVGYPGLGRAINGTYSYGNLLHRYVFWYLDRSGTSVSCPIPEIVPPI